MVKKGHDNNNNLWKIGKIFFGYKALLISILLSVPKQYDTSSRLMLLGCDANAFWGWHVLARGIEKLVIWDSVFFVSIAKRGIYYEHEWAWGRFWSLLISYLTPGNLLQWTESPLLSPEYYYGLTSIVLSITAHWLATLMLYCLTQVVFSQRRDRKRFAEITAILYSLSPAGMFLIAGYSESTFALLSFVGLYLREKRKFILSGSVFALTCGFRGNGVLWGIVFLYDLWATIITDKRNVVKNAAQIICGGSLIGIAVIGLQLYPYFLYCPGRPWCDRTIPSIFGFVQSHYWNVGFLKYWTANNIPNFMFGGPTLYLLWKSMIKFYNIKSPNLLPYLMVQLVIFLSAIFVYHVQIITRIATCLPAMYWYAGDLLTSNNLNQVKHGQRIVTYFILWTMAHAVLFGAFLPPA